MSFTGVCLMSETDPDSVRHVHTDPPSSPMDMRFGMMFNMRKINGAH
jgi:hypothetical protein